MCGVFDDEIQSGTSFAHFLRRRDWNLLLSLWPQFSFWNVNGPGVTQQLSGSLAFYSSDDHSSADCADRDLEGAAG